MKQSILNDSPFAFRLLEVSPSAVLIVDNEGEIVYGNQRLTEWLEFSTKEILGRPVSRILPAWSLCDSLSASATFARDRSHTDNQSRIENRSFLVKNKHGQQLHASVSAHSIAESSRDYWLIHLIAKDDGPGDRRRMQSERLTAIGQMVSGLSHESRNALQIAVACLDLLELDFKHQPDQMKLSSRIRQSLAGIFANYDQVRRYAQPIRPKLQSIDLLDLFQTAFNESVVDRDRSDDVLRFNRATNADLDRKIGGHAVARVDREHMKQVFHHVIENAMNASDDVAFIDVECSRIKSHSEETILFRVFDHGDGIDDENVERVFEPFYTIKKNGTRLGLGLGLAICRRIIEAHGGTMRAIGGLGIGSCVEITIPAARHG